MKTFAFLALSALALAGCSKSGNASNPPVAPPGSISERVAPKGTRWSETVVKTPEGYMIGNPKAELKLVEYGSRLCPTCGALAREGYEPLIKNYINTGKVNFEFREFLVHGPADLPPALLGNCVDKAAFFPVLEQMFHDQAQFDEALQKLTPAQQQQLQAAKPDQVILALANAEGIVPYMKQRGLTQAKIDQCLTNRAEIDRLTKQTQTRGPTEGGGDGTVEKGTPTLLLNGRVLPDVLTWPQLNSVLVASGA